LCDCDTVCCWRPSRRRQSASMGCCCVRFPTARSGATLGWCRKWSWWRTAGTSAFPTCDVGTVARTCAARLPPWENKAERDGSNSLSQVHPPRSLWILLGVSPKVLWVLLDYFTGTLILWADVDGVLQTMHKMLGSQRKTFRTQKICCKRWRTTVNDLSIHFFLFF